MLLYQIPLSVIAYIIGLLYVLGHLPGVLAPAAFTRAIRQFPRHYPMGVILTLVGGAWFIWVTDTADLGELGPYKYKFMAAWAIGTVLQILFMPAFLSVRGLAWIMLLSVNVILDGAFVLDTSSRLVMTSLAYLWAIAAMFLIASPYLLRDAIDFACKTEARCRAFCIPGVAFGMLLIALGFFCY
ncbi:MAG: hypothetical protein ACAI35_16230 [Candidatus Methylacidiphilales bacterium]|nr:hypothetical protein [Candidatus Methylacidiphilales bacterium]